MQQQQHDISDNTGRGLALSTLINAASATAPRPLEAWTGHGNGNHAGPVAAQAGLGSAWKLSNDLRVMSQYTRVLRDACQHNYFLLGSDTTCVERLEWFHSFAQPTRPLCETATQSIGSFLGNCMSLAGHPSIKHAAFEAHRSIMKPDRELTQFLVEQHLARPCMEYELDVCAYMMARPTLTYEDWQVSFPQWRTLGLYYPLALASIYMPNLSCWLPCDVHATKVGMSLQDCLRSFKYPAEDHSQALAKLAQDWKDDMTGTSDVLAGILDRLAILMRVKSNGAPSFALDEALEAFAKATPVAEQGQPPETIHAQNYAAWHPMKRSIETTFPPSLLAVPLVRPKRETWGYARLTLQVGESSPPTVSFAECSLTHVKPKETKNNLAHTYHPPFIKECMLHQTSQRIQDVLWRLGEIATSPSVSACMLRPDLALASLASLGLRSCEATPSQLGADIGSVGKVLERMGSDKACPPDMEDCYMTYTSALDSAIPQPSMHYLPSEKTILMWRLDTPPRAILYMGSGMDVDPRAEAQHHLEKVMVNAKVPHRPIGGIMQAPQHATEDTLRSALRTFARDGLATHPANTVLVTQSDSDAAPGKPTKLAKQTVTPVTCTTLAEAVACFALTRPSALTTLNIGESCAWKEDGIDPRYAEKQTALNGFRFRDWTAMHVDKQGTQQSRLAAHAITYDCIYTTLIPWYLDEGAVKWVQMSSTLHPENRTLQGRSLRHAVESRFLHDLRMLPTQNPQDKVLRSNCEIYTDASGTVGIAYCPENSDTLHFVCFECKENPDPA